MVRIRITIQSRVSFPKGTGSGLFFHDLLENWDQTDSDPHRQYALIAAKLHSHGIDRRWVPAVGLMLENLADTALISKDDRFTLAQVPLDQRINETEFYFPLQRLRPEKLVDLFGHHCSHLLDCMPARSAG